MRTTLDIDDDLLAAARELARSENRTAGQVVSDLLRRSLTGADSRGARRAASRGRPIVAGIEPFTARPGVVVTNEMVNRLRDEEGI